MSYAQLAFCWACLFGMVGLFGVFLRASFPRAVRDGAWACAGLMALASGLFVALAVALAQATLRAWAGPTCPLP